MGRTTYSLPKIAGLLGLLSLIPSIGVSADAPLLLLTPAPSADLAFARYITSTQTSDPFRTVGPVAVEIDASLPGLFKETRFLAIRAPGESEHSEYHVLQIEGDAIVAQEVIARYLRIQQEFEEMPSSSLEVSPENYKFHYKGEVGTGSALAYVYEIMPKKKRDGLIRGELWIDSASGTAILQSGQFVKTPSPFVGKMHFVRDTDLLDGVPIRVTHVTIETPRTGRAELTITELPLPGLEEEPELRSKPKPLALR